MYLGLKGRGGIGLSWSSEVCPPAIRTQREKEAGGHPQMNPPTFMGRPHPPPTSMAQIGWKRRRESSKQRTGRIVEEICNVLGVRKTNVVE